MTVTAQRLAGRGCCLDLGRPRIMGVLNVTPDSFSDGGDFADPELAVQRGLQLQRDGADLLDIGGESTRPGAPSVSPDEELSRVIPVIERLRRETDLPLSIDTNKAVVAREAMRAGCNFINDISGLTFDADMAKVALDTGAGLFLMHTSGRPEWMQQQTCYQDLCEEVAIALQQSVDQALAVGISADKLAIDPGIGFGKTPEGNLELLNRIGGFHQLGYPILLGTSRKSFIGRILQREDPKQRLAGTLATVALGVQQGVQLFRVHDVQPAKDAALVAWSICKQELP